MFIFLYERAGCNHPAANGVTSFSFTNCSLLCSKCKTTSDKALLQFLWSQSAFQRDTKGEKISHKPKHLLARGIISFPVLQCLCSVAAHGKGRLGERMGFHQEEMQGEIPGLEFTLAEIHSWGNQSCVISLSPRQNLAPQWKKLEFLL